MTKKQGIRLVSFVLVLLLTLLGLIKVFGIPTDDSMISITERFVEFYDEPENTWDCVFVGTSCVDREWAAPLAWNDYGMTVYPMNTSVQPIALTTNLLTEVRKKQDVKLAVVDIRGIQKSKMNPIEKRIRRITDNMKYSSNRTETVEKAIDFYKEFYSQEDVEDGAKMLDQLDESSLYFPFLKYHSRWKTGLTRNDFLKKESEMKGVYNYKKRPFKVEKVEPTKVIDGVGELDEMQKGILDEIFEYGQSTNLPMLFISSPVQVSKNDQLELNAALQYLEDKGADVINFNTEEKYEELDLDFSQDLFNESHLNSRGAVKFTKVFSQYLHDTYQFEDKRGQQEYQEWDEAYEKYTEFYESGWKEKSNK